MLDTCPPFHFFMKPLLELASRSDEVKVTPASDTLADMLDLSPEARDETIKSGNYRKYVDRTHWASTYLKQAKLLESSKRGYVRITDRGRNYNITKQDVITPADLEVFQEYVDFQNRTKKSSPKSSKQEAFNLQSPISELTPADKIDEALEEINSQLASEILDRLRQAPPSFFERVVVDLLVSMGYGDVGQARVTGKSGDNGIDGVVDQDSLGLDRVYIQAKRYDKSNQVGSPDIRNFVGSLNYHQANKGLFVTTSSFSTNAYDTAEKVAQRIVLVDGQKLAELLIKHEVGCSPKKTIKVMAIDEDFFDY